MSASLLSGPPGPERRDADNASYPPKPLRVQIPIEQKTAKKMTTEELNDLIRSRRSIYPPEYLDKEIPKDVLETILTNGTYAPNYFRTEPWRFKVLTGEAKNRLGRFLAEAYKANTPPEDFREKKYNKILNKGKKSGAVIAICMKRDPQERPKEWEEMAAVAMAVQNMWLTATQLGIGAYWGTPPAAAKAGKILPLDDGERCLGFFFMGYVENARRPDKRLPLNERVVWLDE